MEIKWDGEAFKSMKNLKVLIFKDVKCSTSPKYLPNSLKVLKWQRYPSSFLPLDFHPKKLVVLDIGHSYLRSLEIIKTSNNLGILNLRSCQHITEIPDLSNLINLKELDLQHCKNLIAIHNSIGYLAKLEILDVTSCVRLKTFPCEIKLPSLKELGLNHCSRLKDFPEILEEVKIKELFLIETGIEKLPWSIYYLTQLRDLWIRQHKVIEIPNSIFLLPELERIIVDNHGKVISAQDQQSIWSMQCPNRVNFCLPRCNISDELLRSCLSRFTNMERLNLTGNNFTVLPSWIKECHFLRDIKLNECKFLRKVEGIPPYVRLVGAINCMSLSLESKNLLLSEDLLGAPSRHSSTNFFLREIYFCVPMASIPNWFGHRRKGGSVSFWFRNHFPPLCLCVLFKATDGSLESNHSYSSMSASVYINGEEVYYRNLWDRSTPNVEHVIVYNIKEDHIPDYKMERACRENKWNHVNIEVDAFSRVDKALIIEESGIYVIKQLSQKEDFRFTNPYERSVSPCGDQNCEIIEISYGAGGGDGDDVNPKCTNNDGN
ncbi:protein SUPPRESSOR OF npr1-1, CONSTITUTIVE 1-like [Prosopis cineraria]|uniref:protein SUPPRESSOR OF npr1-1, CONSTITUTIVE 1-like n=1 Tax=Prosopis cineraria TaxID=364024 RepID=UPI0024104DFD|nr:protein SUPPRESSOR OF npr1-1, CONSTITUTIVE 1-like [Prosopis cineraria]